MRGIFGASNMYKALKSGIPTAALWSYERGETEMKHTFYRNIEKRDTEFISIKPVSDKGEYTDVIYEYDIDGAHKFGIIVNASFAEIDDFCNEQISRHPCSWKEICTVLDSKAKTSQEEYLKKGEIENGNRVENNE